MDRNEFLNLMQFPGEWTVWEMLSDVWVSGAIAAYERGEEKVPEHFRYGAFYFWLRQSPTSEQLVTLARLSWLDPDPPMAEQVRHDIARQRHLTTDVSDAIRVQYDRGS